MYLWRKESGFFFQIRIPSNRIETMGKGHVRVWLGRVSKIEARRFAVALAGAAQTGFEMGMDRETLTKSLKALATEIEALKKREFSSGLSTLAANSRLEQATEDGNADPEFAAVHREKAAAGRAEKAALASVRQRLETVGQALETDAAALTAERAAYAHALATVAAIAPAAVPVASTPVPPPAPAEDEYRDEREITADTLLSVAGRVILDLRKEAKGDNIKGEDRYQERLESALAAFLDVIGDKPIRHYLPIHMQDFATTMAKCPKNRSKYPQFKGLPIRKMVEVNAKSKKPIPTLSVSAVGSLISEVTNLWAKATAGVPEAKNLKDYKVTMPNTARKAIVREGLPVSSLNVWMKAASALYPRDDFKKFMPLVALLTGMRQGELVWLQPKDITEIDGHTVIDLRLPLLIDRKEVNRALKTETSPRIVALHPFLKEAGFIDFAMHRKQWVFGEYHRAKDPSHSAQKQMGNWMRALGIHAEHKHVFHSLRHNAKPWLRGVGGDMGKFIADRQCGHAPGNVGDSYGFPVLQSDEIEKIEALPLPKGVDFSGFLRSS
jgi:integrase